jgi:hypothetical protein
MTPRRDALRAGAHWHVDCRIEAELPKDNVVSGRFIANSLFGSVAFALLLVFAALAYQTWTTNRQVLDWAARSAKSMPEVRVIQGLQREYVAAASQVDQAYGTIRPALFVTQFIGVLGRTLPREISVESLEWTDQDIILRGLVRESRVESGRILTQYVELLKKDPTISPQFNGSIRQIGFDPNKGTFALAFRLQPLPPL